MKRPFDKFFHAAMLYTLEVLMEESGALMGYTESDEMTLMWYSEEYKSQTFFDGKIAKMNSVLAGLCAAKFNDLWGKYCDGDYLKAVPGFPVFDCRVWQVPSKMEAANVFVWRELDATRNSIQMAAQSVCSDKELHGKNVKEQQEMMFQRAGINWNDYDDKFKRGQYLRRQKLLRSFTEREIEKLPEYHEARTNPDLRIERQVIAELKMPTITKVTNRVEVFFDGADPVVEEE